MLMWFMRNLKFLSVFFIATILYFGFSSNNDYANCMKATKHNYISQEGVDHISAQCEAFIKNKAMIK